MTISVTKITACAFDMRHMVRRPPKFQGSVWGMFPAKFRQHKAARHRARGPAFGVRAVRKTVERAGRQGYRKQRTGGHAPQSAGPSSPLSPQLDDLGGRGRHRVDDGLDPLRPVL